MSRLSSDTAELEHASVRRSFTHPSRTSIRPPPRSASTDSADGIEILFLSPTCKIVSFSTAGLGRRSSPARLAAVARGGRERPATSTLAWTTASERTLAVGGLRVYRVITSMVSFLNSGNLLHTVFPRSQCWCVDNQSVFVLRVRQDSYYRIELPYDTDEDKERIIQFKAVLSQVLQYERTQCPFARGFEVDHIDRPKTPPRPRSRQHSLQPTQKAKKWLFDKNWVPEGGVRPSTPVLAGSDCGASAYDDDDRSSVYTDSSEAVLESSETLRDLAPSQPAPRRLSIAERASFFQDMRSPSLPGRGARAMSVASLKGIPESPKVERTGEPVKPALGRHVSEAGGLVSSSGSFYSLHKSAHGSSSTRSLDASVDPMSSWAETKQEHFLRGRTLHRREMSDVTVKPTVDVRRSPAPPTPPLIDDSDTDSIELPLLDAPTPPNAIRMKRLTGATQRRAFSPMPHVQTLFRAQRRNSGREFTNALVRKTCELVLGPPAHLVSLMLRIARSISNGFGFSTYQVSASEQTSCSWESDDEGDWADEDDFGIPLNHVGRTPRRRKTFSGEVD